MRSGNDFTSDLTELKRTIEQQQQLIHSQSTAINELRRQMLEQNHLFKQSKANPPGLPQPLARSPFEAQAIGMLSMLLLVLRP